jgi:hypothetical protein
VPIRVRVVDAAGNVAESSTSVVIDRDGPRLLPSSRGEVWRDPAGAVLGIRYVLEFDADLDPQAAQAPESYALFRAGGDRLFYDGDDLNQSARIASITYRPSDASAAVPARVEVLVPLQRGGADNDDYELTAFAGRVVDAAANPLVGGDARLRVRFEFLPPIVESAFLLSPVAGEAPTQVLVQFRDVLGLRDTSGRLLENGDHVVAFQLGADGGALAIAQQQPGANPDGPGLQQAVLGGGTAPRLLLSFNQPVDAAEAVRASNYVIVGAGSDGRLRTPDDELTVLPSAAVSLSGDGRTVTLNLEGLDAGHYFVRIDGTGDAELDEQAARNPDNYRLDRLGADGQTVTIGSLHFNSFGDRVILSDFGSLGPGVYRLVVFTGIANSSGTALDGDFDGQGGDSYVQIFNVQAEPPPAQLTLNADAFERNHAALEAFALQTQEDVVTSAKALAEADFAARLLTEVEIITAIGPAESSTEIADAIHEAVRQTFEARLAELPVLPNEYVVVWSHNARFLLADAADPERQIGFRLDGAPIDDRLAGGVVLGSAFAEETGLPRLSLAIVPIDPVSHFFIGPPAVDLSGNALLPTLGFTIELEGLDVANQVGLLFYGVGGLVDQATFLNVPPGVEDKELSAPSGITGFDPAVFIIDSQVQAEVDAVLGTRRRRSYLVVWVDPVDFALLDPHLRQAGAVSGQNFLSIPGAFFSGNGFTELVVIANPVGGTYRLDLFGLGADFRGALRILTSDLQVNAPFQGRLATREQAAAVIDVLAGPRELPPSADSPVVLTPPSIEIARELVRQLTAMPSTEVARLDAPIETKPRIESLTATDSGDDADGGTAIDNLQVPFGLRTTGPSGGDEPPPPTPPPPHWLHLIQFLQALWRHFLPMGSALRRFIDDLPPAVPDGNANPESQPGGDRGDEAPPGGLVDCSDIWSFGICFVPIATDLPTVGMLIGDGQTSEHVAGQSADVTPISVTAGTLVLAFLSSYSLRLPQRADHSIPRARWIPRPER